MVSPAPPNPPNAPRPPPKPGAPLARGAKLAFGLLAAKPPRPVLAAEAGAVRAPDREGDATDGDRDRDAEDDVEETAAGALGLRGGDDRAGRGTVVTGARCDRRGRAVRAGHGCGRRGRAARSASGPGSGVAGWFGS